MQLYMYIRVYLFLLSFYLVVTLGCKNVTSNEMQFIILAIFLLASLDRFFRS